jgi:ComF family protein
MEPPADALVHALKYEGWKELAGTMAQRMADAMAPVPGEALVTHVPTTTARRRRRGYDQAEVLAEAVAERLGFPRICALERRGGATQVRLSPEARRQNVKGKFRISPSSRSRMRGVEVILIDDVLTTGATATAAASVLGEAGVRSVRLLTYARALPLGADRKR